MSKQLLHLNQVKGANKDTLADELKCLIDNVKHFSNPVNFKADLPYEDNVNGQICLVIDEDSFYIWNEQLSSWHKKQYISTESRLSLLSITNNGQTEFHTDISIGVANGVSDTSTVFVMINGQMQLPEVDYIVLEDHDNQGKMLIKWISKDFILESDDIIYITYDILKFR